MNTVHARTFTPSKLFMEAWTTAPLIRTSEIRIMCDDVIDLFSESLSSIHSENLWNYVESLSLDIKIGDALSYDVVDCWFFRSLARFSFSSSGLGGLWTWSLPDTTRIVYIFEPATTVRFLIIVDEVERVGKLERHRPTRLHILRKNSH